MNPHGAHGHIAIIRPGVGEGGPRIAQASGTNFNDGTPQYFVHD